MPDPDVLPLDRIDPAASHSRIACATALRQLGHAIVGHAVDDAVLDRVRGFVDDVLPAFDGAPPRSRPVDDMKRRLFDVAPQDGESLEHYPDCIVSGPANPMGIALSCHRAGDDAVASVRFGAAFEGAPGRAHGGIVAAVFDDVIDFDLEFRARLRERDGRKLWIDGEAIADGVRFAEADGLFIAIPLEQFGSE